MEESNVLVGDEDVDESTQRPTVVEDAKGDPGVRLVNGDDRVSDRRRLDGHLARATDEGAQLAREADDDAHDAATNWWKRNAASASASDGLIVELTVALSTTASRVLSP